LLFWKTAFSRFLLKSPLLRVHFKQIIHCGIIALEIFFSSVDSSEFSNSLRNMSSRYRYYYI